MFVCGVLVSINGIGVLIRGKSRTGKSSCALKLISEGGKLVSDDVVDIRKFSDRGLIGQSPSRTKDLIEIRNMGIANIRYLFGDEAVTEKSTIHMIVELSEKGGKERLERDTGVNMMGIHLPAYRFARGFPMEAAEAVRHITSAFDIKISSHVRKEEKA